MVKLLFIIAIVCLCTANVYPYDNSKWQCDGSEIKASAANRNMPEDEKLIVFNNHQSKGLVSSNNNKLMIYPWNPIDLRKILPNTFPIPSESKDSISIKMCRGEWEPASFIIRSTESLSNLQLEKTDLLGENNTIIPKSFVDIRIVKCWYQSSIDSMLNKRKKFLVPELLLKNDQLVVCDYNEHRCLLKVRQNNEDRYYDVSSKQSKIPESAQIEDAHKLLPFKLKKEQNKQIWITVKAPKNCTPGAYNGKITLQTDSKILTTISFRVTVLPFELEDPLLEYGIYYHGRLFHGFKKGSGGIWKSAKQYQNEMINIIDHGVSYPTFHQPYDPILIKKSLDIRKKVELPTDKLYVLSLTTGKPTPEKMKWFPDLLSKWVKIGKINGYKQIYIYGSDEAKGKILHEQREILALVHSMGAKSYVACSKDAVNIVGDLVDTAVLHGNFKPQIVKRWHENGKQVFIYSNPQVGLENPAIYRKNFGLRLWCEGYDGAMDYAYQTDFGHIWNDFDHNQFRDHVFAYPTEDGLVDTVQWEGFREAVDDVRYLATLIKMSKATIPEIRAKIYHLLNENTDLYSIREEIINEILNTMK